MKAVSAEIDRLKSIILEYCSNDMNYLSNNITGKEQFYFLKYEKSARKYLIKNKIAYDLLFKYVGCTVDKGLFKFHTIGSSYIWTKYVSQFFADYHGRIYCFGFDWMGRQFAFDLMHDIIYMFDSATCEVFLLEGTLEDFLQNELIHYKEETFNSDFFEKLYNEQFTFSKCFGFKIPLFLNGKDEISNYECIDMEVYWDVNYQLFNRIKNLPGGTLIGSVNIDQD